MSARSVLVPMPADQWGGLQTFAVNVAKGLRDAGWRWTVVVPPEAHSVRDRLRDEGVEAFCHPLPRFRRSPWLSLRALIRMPRAVRELANLPVARHAAVVQAVGAHHFHGAAIARQLRKPLVWQLHSDILAAPLRRTVGHLIVRTADVVMTNGAGVAKSFWADETSIPNHLLFYAPVDTARFTPDSQLRDEARSALGIEQSTVLIGTVGNHVWQKNHELLVKVARDRRTRFPQARFVIFGGDHAAYERTYERRVVRRAEEINTVAPGYVRFVDPGRNVRSWIQALDVFVLTSHAEGVPIALCEAMSAGKPVLSANVGSISDVVVHGDTGFLCAPGDAREFAGLLEILINNERLRKAMSNAGRTRILERFSLEAVVRAHVQAYETAMAQKAEPAAVGL